MNPDTLLAPMPKRTRTAQTVLHTIQCKNGGIKRVKLTRTLAIKVMCTQCIGEEHPSRCSATLCPLYPYRGKTRIADHGKSETTGEQA